MSNSTCVNDRLARLAILLTASALAAGACGAPSGFGSGPDTEAVRPVYRKPAPPDLDTLRSRLALVTEADPDSGTRTSKGTFAVPENRRIESGRMIHLTVVVLHAEAASPRPDPFFPLAGGPGADITRAARAFTEYWVREQRDIVLVSQRGTGGDNRLDCDVNGTDENIQTYLGPLFTIDDFLACRRRLEQNFDLTCYSTFDAADDINELRLALGYDEINLSGGSYGTRMALIYMRQYPETVRSAILDGVIPPANKNPLFHAPSAQEAVRRLMAECAEDPDCADAFPNLEDKFHIVLERLGEQPEEVTVTHPVTGAGVPIVLTRSGFAEALRTMMYSRRRQPHIPRLIHQAYEGDFEPFAQAGLERERAIRRTLAFGHLLCVTCSEDVDRITEAEITAVTEGTFQGDERVREQIAVCGVWPRSVLPDDFGDPVTVDVPVLLFSGDLDPVTPPRWGDEAARHLPRALHVIVPGAHGVGGACIRSIERAFLEKASVEGLDLSCIRSLSGLEFIVKR